MRTLLYLSLLLGSVGAFKIGTVLSPVLRVPAISMIEPVETVDECVAESETGEEAAECILPIKNEPAPARSKSLNMKPSAAEKREHLMGAAESLDQCISEAENGSEVEECELDYDKLVTGGGAGMQSVAPIAAGVVALGAVGFFYLQQ